MKLSYIFPKIEDFREDRPTICWEHMYGWIDGYGLLFDPVVLSLTQTIPEWQNGRAETNADDDFVIACCSQAAALFHTDKTPGLYIRPHFVDQELLLPRYSEKDALTTPAGSYFYPYGLPYSPFNDGIPKWQVGESTVAKLQNRQLAVGFEFFAMIEAWRGDWPMKRLTEGANILHALLSTSGAWTTDSNSRDLDTAQEELRLDFQAYGLNRLMLQWLLDRKGADRNAVTHADRSVLAALNAWQGADAESTKAHLRTAFECLTEIRRDHSKLELCFLEFPHLGILFEKVGFFELEWPEQTRQTLLSYLANIKQHGYRVNLEGGASCWKNLAKRFPSLIGQLQNAWSQHNIEMTNGTFALPLALFSPLALQYWQFRSGQETFSHIFGRTPSVYQCQESSFSPQIPELLRHFGYTGAVHIAQNRGYTPGDDADAIRWQSPAGHGVDALTVRDPVLAQKGVNYFLDVPLVHDKYGTEDSSLTYTNCQDLGYVPFRTHMIRAHRYAPVWGSFATVSERLAETTVENPLPKRGFAADDYHQSDNFFYPGTANANAFSHYELIFGQTAQWRQAQLHAWLAGKWEDVAKELRAAADDICLLEAHDMSLVQDTHRGQFHANQAMLAPPCTGERLMHEVPRISGRINSALASVQAAIAGTGETESLLNAAGVPLAFSHVAPSTTWTAGNTIPFKGRQIVLAPFAAWQTMAPSETTDQWEPCKLPEACGVWQTAITKDGHLQLSRNNQRAVLLRPVDHEYGPLRLTRSSASRCGPLGALELVYESDTDFVQTVILDVLLAEGSQHAELNVRYAPGRTFDAVGKWADYLAIEVDLGAPLKQTWRFNPNVRAETRETQVCSPYCLEASGADNKSVALLNEGAFCYELDRDNGRVRWLFHVAGENVWQRRMAIAFDANNAFQLSRAWGQGLLAVGGTRNTLPVPREGWDGVSVETVVGNGIILISNLDADERVLTFAPDAALEVVNVSETTLLSADTSTGDICLTLKPFELAFLRTA